MGDAACKHRAPSTQHPAQMGASRPCCAASRSPACRRRHKGRSAFHPAIAKHGRMDLFLIFGVPGCDLSPRNGIDLVVEKKRAGWCFRTAPQSIPPGLWSLGSPTFVKGDFT